MTVEPGLAGWLQLTLTPGLGATSIRNLLGRFGLPESVLSAPSKQLESVVGSAAAALLRSKETAPAVERALRWAEAPSHAVVTLADTVYPGLLLEIPDPPALLYAVGRLELLARRVTPVTLGGGLLASGGGGGKPLALPNSAAASLRSRP